MSVRWLPVAPAAAFLFVTALTAAAADLWPLTITGASGTHEFSVEVADDPHERETGLMYRLSLDPDQGMLFDFGTPQPISMWMKNTYITLDMVFIDAAGQVSSIAKETTPFSRATISSKGPVRYVLEINGGRAQALGIRPGDTISGIALSAQ